MSGPAVHDITIQQGSDYGLQVQLENQDVNGVVTPVDISGATIKMEVRIDYADFARAILITASTGDGRIVITDGPNGIFDISIPGSATGLEGEIPKDDTGKYDIDVTLVSGAKSTPLGGDVTFGREVTV